MKIAEIRKRMNRHEIRDFVVVGAKGEYALCLDFFNELQGCMTTHDGTSVYVEDNTGSTKRFKTVDGACKYAKELHASSCRVIL